MEPQTDEKEARKLKTIDVVDVTDAQYILQRQTQISDRVKVRSDMLFCCHLSGLDTCFCDFWNLVLRKLT